MLLTIADPDLLKTAVAWACQAIGPRPHTPVMAAVHLHAEDGELTVSGFDYETSASATIPVAAADGERRPSGGDAYVPGRLLAEIAGAAPRGKPVTLDDETEDGRLVIRAGTVFRLLCLPPEEYPVLPPVPPAVGVIDGKELAARFGSVLAAVARDDSVPALTAARIEGGDEDFTAVATDRFRLHVAEAAGWQGAPGTAGWTALIPGPALALAARHADGPVTIHAAEGMAGFSMPGFQMTSRQLTAEFPKWGVLYQGTLKGELVLTVHADAAKLKAAADRVALVAEKGAGLCFTFGDGQVRVAGGEDAGATAIELLAVEMEWAGEAEKDGRTVWLNPAYLGDCLTSAGTEQVRMEFREASKPVIITDCNETRTFRALLMPIRKDHKTQ